MVACRSDSDFFTYLCVFPGEPAQRSLQNNIININITKYKVKPSITKKKKKKPKNEQTTEFLKMNLTIFGQSRNKEWKRISRVL